MVARLTAADARSTTAGNNSVILNITGKSVWRVSARHTVWSWSTVWSALRVAEAMIETEQETAAAFQVAMHTPSRHGKLKKVYTTIIWDK